MNLRQVVYPFSIAVVLVVFQPHGRADTNVEESRDLQESFQAARQSVASTFSGLLKSILAAQAGNRYFRTAIQPRFLGRCWRKSCRYNIWF